MIAGSTLLGLALALPPAMLLACLSRGMRARMPALLWLAPVPALAAALFAADGTLLELGNERLRLTFYARSTGRGTAGRRSGAVDRGRRLRRELPARQAGQPGASWCAG